MTDDNFELWDLRIEVVEGDGPTVCGRKNGAHFTVSGEEVSFPEGASFSFYELSALLPLLAAKQRALHPNDWMSTDSEVACPDPNCGARFRIMRTSKREFRHAETTRTPLNRDDT
ncbi:MAG: TIGR04076 family protein [Alphaproteobacteria bacterium]|jgi:uncharacterized repeat protein (TIGR04076 family)|nr:TIGR04076 family protein [Rhodospirillaceae bacterium]MBT6511003.1 TIGR04076 family protein [Rhodospirillaceae bacterium]MDG2479406.1 TIGR04076 family protein [Alphaproteobacteria bacterium]